MKLIAIILICAALLHSSCNNNESAHPLPVDNYHIQQQNDSVLKEKIAEEIIKNALYDHSKDTVRQGWIRSHHYMWYRSKVYMAESCGYDKNGLRKVTQNLGTRNQNNAFCINRRAKTITWVTTYDGKDETTDYQITEAEEHPDLTSFHAIGDNGESATFNVYDNGRRIYVLNVDATLTFFLTE